MNLPRRQFLTGAAAAGALTPFAQSLRAQVQPGAEAEPPLRFVFCIKSNGLWAEMIQPRNLRHLLPFKLDYDEKGRLIDGDNGKLRKAPTPAAAQAMGDDLELSEVMGSLEPFKDRVSVLQGVNSGFSTYHMGCYQTLGAFQGRGRNSTETLGPTVDALLARAFPRPVPHLCLGHDPRSPSGVAYVPTSAAAAGKPMPFYTLPKRAYKDLFGVIDEGAARAQYDTQSDILAFFAEDAERLRREIAAPERVQLDLYLDAFSAVQKSRREVEAISDQLREHAPPPPGEIDANATMEIGAGNATLAIAALLSGLTNVVTLRFDLLGATSYEGIGGLHGGVGHGQVKNILQARETICEFQIKQIARIATALEAVPEGEGTMLDNTVFVYTSDNGETHHSSGVNYPILLLGDLGGRLARNRYFAPGDEVADRGQPSYTRLGDVWATLLAAAGQPHPGFGIPVNGVPHQPIESLLA